jgi:hypothetical protein
VASVLLGGCQFKTNIQAHSGGPLGMSSTNGDNAGAGHTLWFFGEFRANQSGSAKVPHPNKKEWFDPAAFSSPSGTCRNTGRTSAKDPLWQQSYINLVRYVIMLQSRTS